MKPRLTALLVHGMGNTAAWWNTIIPHLSMIGITPEALEMPSAERSDPETWVELVVARVREEPVILIGHSLGAAVVIQAALKCRVHGLILLALPPFSREYIPDPPKADPLSATAVARCGRFIHAACMNGSALAPVDIIHFAGEKDPYVPGERAGALPFPLTIIPGAGHELNKSRSFMQALKEYCVTASCGKAFLDPGVRYSVIGKPGFSPVAVCGLDDEAPLPARIDIEITTRCQLACAFCARTLYRKNRAGQDMQIRLFERILDQIPWAQEIYFVGLGEPLLHPQVERFVVKAAAQGMQTKLVTNGILAGQEMLKKLRDSGLTEITFSIDTADERANAQVRAHAPLSRIIDNLRNVPDTLRRSIFVTLSKITIDSLAGIIDIAAELGLPALALSDVNFPENQGHSLNTMEDRMKLVDIIRYAHEKNVLLISPHFHNMSAAIPHTYQLYMVRIPADMKGRSCVHKNCLAPWRIAVVSVDGVLSPCNCAPEVLLGNIQTEQVTVLWNGPAMKQWRRDMKSHPSDLCRCCPRF